LYERPANAFVADFIGENNFIPGKVISVQDGTAIVEAPSGEQVRAQAADGVAAGSPTRLSVRPEKLFVLPNAHPYDNHIKAKFITRHYVGDFIRYYFSLSDGTEINLKVLNDSAAPHFSPGETAGLVWLEKDCFAYPV
jgi:putative spermidine/putrescine transport system ATP-binding protein